MLVITFHNLSDGQPVSDYEYSVYINRRLIETGIVSGHTRAEGWRELIERLLDETEPKRDTL